MATWLIPLRGSTEVIDLDAPSVYVVATVDKPMITLELQASKQQPALTKHVNPPGSSYRSYGGTIASMQKRLRSPALAETPLPKKVCRT